MESLGYAIAVAAAYVLGSVPCGYLVARWRGVDIRQLGSGNIGATNVMRTLGKPAGVTVFLLDVLKGFAAASWLATGAERVFGLQAFDGEWFRILLGVVVVLGHNYTVWLRFKGGKGIATSAGVLGALVPGGLAISLSLWAVVTLLTRYVSLGSIAASISLPFASWATGGSRVLIAATALMGGMAIFKHRGNIQRLMRGTESRLAPWGSKKEASL